METYGLPIWGSYIIFALFTIVLGALLGLVNLFLVLANSLILIGDVLRLQLLVCIIDCIYPPRPYTKVADDKVEIDQVGK
jgi:hypothetical protein